MSEKLNYYTGKPRKITFIGSYYYGVCQIEESFYICIQKMGDINWLIKDESFFSQDRAIQVIREIEKEHYDKLKFEAGKS